MWSLCASWVRAWGWARIGSSCLCASLHVSLQNASRLVMYWLLQPLWSRLAALWCLCASVCNLFFVFFFMCLVMYRFMFLFRCVSWVFFFAQLQCCLARAIGTKSSAVLLMSLTFSSLFEVHACISITCFHYPPGYPVERSFFFRHFALVYIETKLLFVLSEFPARMGFPWSHAPRCEIHKSTSGVESPNRSELVCLKGRFL